MQINPEEVRKSAIKTIEKSERLIALTKKEEWKDFVEVLDYLLANEIRGLAGQKLDHDYYRKIGYAQTVSFVKAIPDVVKDAKIREYLVGQGRARALQAVKNIPFFFLKQRRAAEDQLAQVLKMQAGEVNKDSFLNDTYKNS